MYLVFDKKSGRHVRMKKLPQRVVPPPEPADERWHILGWPDYCICKNKHLWHRPYITQHGRHRGWQRLSKMVKNGYAGFILRKDARPYWMSIRQLLPKCVRVKTDEQPA